MNAETQIEQPATVPEIAPVGESSDSKQSKRGGKRPGAGRKPNLARRLLKGYSREAIAAGAASIDCGAVIAGLLKSKREKTRLETLAFLRDTLEGRPAQNLNLSGGLVHAHVDYRPLQNLTEEELNLLAKIRGKLTAPVSPNAPQNQIESKPAIEAEALESEAAKA